MWAPVTGVGAVGGVPVRGDHLERGFKIKPISSFHRLEQDRLCNKRHLDSPCQAAAVDAMSPHYTAHLLIIIIIITITITIIIIIIIIDIIDCHHHQNEVP